jgi:hypothetical protein
MILLCWGRAAEVPLGKERRESTSRIWERLFSFSYLGTQRFRGILGTDNKLLLLSSLRLKGLRPKRSHLLRVRKVSVACLGLAQKTPTPPQNSFCCTTFHQICRVSQVIFLIANLWTETLHQTPWIQILFLARYISLTDSVYTHVKWV